jgi:hypothetical protein
MKARKGQPVRVVWLDAVNGDGWWAFDELAAEQPAEVVSVGFLVHADKERVVITTSIEGGEGLGWVVIPAAWIKEVQVLIVDEAKESGS